MHTGGFLYLEEFSRSPEDTVNTLLGAVADRSIAVPSVGVVTAAPSFRVLASMNPPERTAAATVGALAGELARDALEVVAFWSDGGGPTRDG